MKTQKKNFEPRNMNTYLDLQSATETASLDRIDLLSSPSCLHESDNTRERSFIYKVKISIFPTTIYVKAISFEYDHDLVYMQLHR